MVDLVLQIAGGIVLAFIIIRYWVPLLILGLVLIVLVVVSVGAVWLASLLGWSVLQLAAAAMLVGFVSAGLYLDKNRLR